MIIAIEKIYICLEMYSELVRDKQIIQSAINNSMDFFTFPMPITFHYKNNIPMKHDATETIKTLSILQKAFDIRFKCGLAKTNSFEFCRKKTSLWMS